MKTELVCIAVVALAWGGYPLLSRSTAVAGPLGALLLTLFSLLPIATATWLDPATRPPSLRDLGRLAFAGLLMGCGTTAYNTLATSRQLEASVSIPVANTAMLIVAMFAAVLFFAEPLTARKLAGVALLVGGIALLRPQ
jgi:drug/metabolite transporter (DMT)-like permease